jgi:hypothetical protein
MIWHRCHNQIKCAFCLCTMENNISVAGVTVATASGLVLQSLSICSYLILSSLIFFTSVWNELAVRKSYWNIYFINYRHDVTHFPVEFDVISDGLPVYVTVLLVWLMAFCLHVYHTWSYYFAAEHNWDELNTHTDIIYLRMLYDLHQGVNSSSQIYWFSMYEASILAGLWFSD